MTSDRVRPRGLALDAGRPAVIVPVVSAGDATERAAEAVAAGADVVEWRIDLAFASPVASSSSGASAPPFTSTSPVMSTSSVPGEPDVLDAERAAAALPAIRVACGTAPLLVTFRTTVEGGSGELLPERYVALLAALAAAGADAVDVEADHPAASEAVAAIRRQGGHGGGSTAVVLSHHDFGRTPPQQEIVDRLAAMEHAGADVAKIAVMPRSTPDVLTLLAATAERAERARIPLVTMSMGDLGAPTRLVGGRFGSAATFASISASSAPGQLPVADVRATLDALDRTR
ncbi:MAG: type I 3-dehydroquinate dehydratase [Actinomycetales bacterium]